MQDWLTPFRPSTYQPILEAIPSDPRVSCSSMGAKNKDKSSGCAGGDEFGIVQVRLVKKNSTDRSIGGGQGGGGGGGADVVAELTAAMKDVTGGGSGSGVRRRAVHPEPRANSLSSCGMG